MPSITFDRFDGGLLLARPSSVAPANSLANLFNMDVQPGGALRSRASWRRTPTQVAMSSQVVGLRASGGVLWSFARSHAQSPSNHVFNFTTGHLYNLGDDNKLIVAFLHDTAQTGNNQLRLVGSTPWEGGILAVIYDITAGQYWRVCYTYSEIGGFVTRSTITDINMPISGAMVTIGRRVFAIGSEGTTVRYSAIVETPGAHPTDWTTAGNAGFLPVAQHFGSGSRAWGLGVYQGKLAVFSERSVQLWSVDADPTAMSLDNVIDGVGTRHHDSIVPLNGDLLFLSETGVRSLTTLQNSLFPTDVDLGLPIEAITKAPPLYTDANNVRQYSRVLGLAAGPFRQYWIASDSWTFGSSGEYGWAAWSFSRQAKLNAWAWHGAGGTPRAQITAWATLGNRVFARTNREEFLLQMVPGMYGLDQTETGAFATCSVRTQWLDFGKPGKRKTITGLDFDGKNVASITILTSAGGDRNGVTGDTIPVGSSQNGWTYSGEMIPTCVDGTEFSLSLFGGGTAETQVNRITLHYEEMDAG